MVAVAWVMLAGAAALAGYAYLAYPMVLLGLAATRRRPPADSVPSGWNWPPVSILVPVHNAESVLADTLEALLALEYPAPRQVLVVSDASTDGTEAIAARYHPRGVRCLRLPVRRGKTAAENLAARHLTNEIVITVDASSRLPRQALCALVGAFADPAVGVASGHDISVGDQAAPSSEGGYVGYEMWVRRWETACGGIVGASGCFYAERAHLYRHPLPEHLSRDFAAALVARLHGYRAVSVPGAVCQVRRIASLSAEYRRKVRTMARGLATLWHFRALLHPKRGWFAWMLVSHKLCRWLVPWALAGALAGACWLTLHATLAGAPWLLALTAILAGGAALGLRAGAPAPCRVLAFALAANIAAVHAWAIALSGRTAPYWDPTVRPGGRASTTPPGGGASPETSAA